MPVSGTAGIQSYQRIYPDGGKYNFKDGGMQGGFFIIPGNEGKPYIAEGIATALSVHEATGAIVFVTFSAGNLEAVAHIVRDKYPNAEIIIAGDDDHEKALKTGKNTGRIAAEAAARSIGAKVAFPLFTTGRGKDFNDLHQTEGLGTVKVCLEGAREPEQIKVEDEWPEPLPLPDGLHPVASFDMALMPEVLRPWVSDIVDRMQCPPEYVAVSVMVALGSIIGRKVGIRPQANTDWTVYPNMWGLLIGRPGVIKSPAMEAALAPLKRLSAEAMEMYSRESKEYENTVIINKLRAEAGEKAARSVLKDNPNADVSHLLNSQQEDPPILKRYMVNDTTAAALGELHRQNPNGLLVFRDELLSLLKMLDQPENSEARGFYLTSWNGDSPYIFDRISRGMNLYIPAVCLSMLGSTQPGRISQYVKGTLSGGDSDDGLLQRFNLIIWPDSSATWKEVDRWPDNEAKRMAFDSFVRTSSMVFSEKNAMQDRDFNGKLEGTPYLRFDQEGLGLFREWRQDLETKLRSGELHPALESHLAKYRKLVPGIALITHVSNGYTGPVGKESVLMALAWSEYLETHAKRVYGSITAPEVETAKRILNKIKNRSLKEPITTRQILRPQWSGLSDIEDIKAGIKTLQDFGYLTKKIKNTGGRPSEEYEVHPIVWGQK
ncbi:MAG: DUF3987 domain-containing protein [Deltaproteobacteria bacterium]|nr:DUF3987 domain-containing protein [Deltaproteobacteria bacterium]